MRDLFLGREFRGYGRAQSDAYGPNERRTDVRQF